MAWLLKNFTSLSMAMFKTCLLLSALVQHALADHYAVLVAGSHTYGNYRHHADVAHAYHVAIRGGIPSENIIVMMYDDVVNDQENPFPGQLFNQPTPAGTPGVDVYHGVKKDYTGKDVTAANFLSIITGDAAAMKNIGTGRVLSSTSEDRVFINFVDHGGVGLIAFPNQPYLYKKDLQGALVQMHKSKMYKELVFYLEACESGSMFEDFPTGMNMYITTAANGKESSWGTYCAPNDMVNGTTLNTCLGDLYSVNWLENSDNSNTKTETLQEQYEKVKKLTNKSHVMQFGDVSTIGPEPVADFIGNDDGHMGSLALPLSTVREGHFDSRDHELNRFFHSYARTEDPKEALRLIAEIQHRVLQKSNIENIVLLVTKHNKQETARLMDAQTYYTPTQDLCQKTVNLAYDQHCGGYSDYSLKFVRVMVNLCETTQGTQTNGIVAAIAKTCSK